MSERKGELFDFLSIFTGGALSVITIFSFLLLSDRQLQECSAIMLAAIAGAYWGFAASDGRAEAKVLEGLVGLSFCLLALIGLWWNPRIIAIGYMAHGLWDIVHHRSGAHAKIPLWWIPLCVVYDWALGIFLLMRWW